MCVPKDIPQTPFMKPALSYLRVSEALQKCQGGSGGEKLPILIELKLFNGRYQIP